MNNWANSNWYYQYNVSNVCFKKNYIHIFTTTHTHTKTYSPMTHTPNLHSRCAMAQIRHPYNDIGVRTKHTPNTHIHKQHINHRQTDPFHYNVAIEHSKRYTSFHSFWICETDNRHHCHSLPVVVEYVWVWCLGVCVPVYTCGRCVRSVCKCVLGIRLYVSSYQTSYEADACVCMHMEISNVTWNKQPFYCMCIIYI